MGPREQRRPIADQLQTLDKAAMEQGSKHGLNATKLSACVKAQDDKAVKASAAEGDALGVDSTPTLFINGEKLAGAMPADVLGAVIDRALKAEGIAVPEKPRVNIVPTPSAMPKQ
jgi:protein-disulfide isomerase